VRVADGFDLNPVQLQHLRDVAGSSRAHTDKAKSHDI